MTTLLERRAGGLLMHPTSLPGPHGCGDIGPEAHAFADFLAASGLRWWQMLPVGPPGASDSPYSSASSFAGSRLLVSLDALAAAGLLDAADLQAPPRLAEGRVDYAAARAFRSERLRKAFARFGERKGEKAKAYASFAERNADWLDDWALFAALKDESGGRPWWEWPKPLRSREVRALAEARERLAEALRFQRFVQFEFDRQWSALRAHCKRRRVHLMGDIPIFVARDSADLWAHQELFHLDASGRPRVVAGVPPDYFSATGQLWGNPLYRWEAMKEGGYAWWIARLRHAFERFDAVRLDHFIGFARCWEVPGHHPTAEHGRWRKGPGSDFFEAVFKKLGRVQLVAEDLGSVTPEVEALRDRFELPGMKVLQFCFGPDAGAEPLRPHNFERRLVVYTGTHDNDTSRGWFQGLVDGGDARLAERDVVQRYLATDGHDIHWQMLRMAWMSVARLAIAPVQDVLGLGSDDRMNRPGTADGNWGWRAAKGALDRGVAERLRSLTATYGRLGQGARDPRP
jgi:4-alpha-glucanotransferase